MRATGGADKGIDGNKLQTPPGGVKGHLCFMRQGAPNVEKTKEKKRKERKTSTGECLQKKSYCLIGQLSGSGEYLIG